MIVQIVDEADQINAFVSTLEKVLDDQLVTLSDVHARAYRQQDPTQLRTHRNT